MHLHDAYMRILRSLHEAALGSSGWEAISGQIDEVCGSKGNLLVLGHPREIAGVLFARLCYGGRRHEEWEQEYYRRYQPQDEHLPRLRQLPDNRIVHVTELFTEHEQKTSPTWNEVMAASNFQDSLRIRLHGRDEANIYWSFADPVDAEGWTTDRMGMITRLMPHVRQFVRVRHELEQAQAHARSLGELLDNDRAGIVQLDRSARIVAANDTAVEILREGDGLYEQGGVLRTRLPGDGDRLRALLERAISPYRVQAESGSMVVTRRNGVLPLVLHASPVEKPELDFRSRRVAALVLIVDARKQSRVDPGLVAQVLGLTQAESEIAVLLSEGTTTREIGLATRRRKTTIKWHLRHIYNKLGVARQLDVVRLVLALADVPTSLVKPPAPVYPHGRHPLVHDTAPPAPSIGVRK